MIFVCVVTMYLENPYVASLLPAIYASEEPAKLRVLNHSLSSELAVAHQQLPFTNTWFSDRHYGCATARHKLTELIVPTPDSIFVFMDDDIEAVDDGWLEKLTAPIIAGEADIVGVEGRRVQFDNNGEFITVHVGTNSRPDYVSGGWCAVSGRVFEAGVQFDADYYPNYWEDVDFCLKARLKGFRIMSVGDVGLVHHQQGGNVQHAIFTREVFARKWTMKQIEGFAAMVIQKTFTGVLSVNDYAEGMRFRKEWEVQRAVDTLEYFGAVHKDAEILGVGAGKEPTIFILSSKVKRVWATDMYAAPEQWAAHAPPEMLTDAWKFAPVGVTVEPRHIVVQHMDGRSLTYPDSTFDGIFSSGSIEHFGEWEDILQAGCEMFRVLKPGGIASISTEFKISGNGDGWDSVKLFDKERLQWFIENTGFVLADGPITADMLLPDSATLATECSLADRVQGYEPPVEAVLSFQKYLFTSVHLALNKPVPSVADTTSEKPKATRKTGK